MSKRAKRIIRETVKRWRDTILREGPADVAGAKALLNKIYPKHHVFVVDTPMQFYIAQAVIRRRISKKFAKQEACIAGGIDSSFVDELAAVGRPLDMMAAGREWHRRNANTVTDRVISANLLQLCSNRIVVDDTAANTYRVMYNNGRSRFPRTGEGNENLVNKMIYQTGDVMRLFAQLIPHDSKSIMYRIARDCLNFSTNPVSRACWSLNRMLSESLLDIVVDDGEHYNPEAHAYDASQAEIMCRMMGCKDPYITSIYELFHMVPTVMKFNGAFLLLGNRPVLHTDSAGNLHNESGMAVQYQDGTGFWFLDGHILRECGKEIVTDPTNLSAERIQDMQNEEERRIAIDRYGWGRYMRTIGARVIDRRENWIDNTVEVLIDTPSRTSPHGYKITEPLRAVLSCRSTGRRYILAVPRETNFTGGRRGRPTEQIKNCEMVQNWMANGATTEFLEYAKLPVRIVGAS